MLNKINFKEVSTIGLESSPVANTLSGLRANDSRYLSNKYNIEFATISINEDKEILKFVNEVLKERDIEFKAKALEVSSFVKEGIQFAYVYYEDGLGISLMYGIDDSKKRAVGFRLSDGMEIPEELKDKFKFARQKSKLAGTIRGSFFVIKKEYDLIKNNII